MNDIITLKYETLNEMIVYVITNTHGQHNHTSYGEHTSTLLVINTTNFQQTPGG